MGDFIIDMCNIIIEMLGAVVGGLFMLFPDSPFRSPETPPDTINLGWITWLFDFPTWILHFSLIVTAIATYYIIRVVARWVKLVRS